MSYIRNVRCCDCGFEFETAARNGKRCAACRAMDDRHAGAVPAEKLDDHLLIARVRRPHLRRETDCQELACRAEVWHRKLVQAGLL